MRLHEVLTSSYFELLMLTETVDEEVLRHILEDRNLTLTFNSLAVDINGEDLMTSFGGEVSTYLRNNFDANLPLGVDPSSYFASFGRMAYDVKLQCLYVEEKYSIPTTYLTRPPTHKSVMLPERICADGMQNKLKIYESHAKFDQVYKEREHELINLRVVLGLTG